MAGEALQREVRVARVLVLGAHGVRGVLLPVVARAAQLDRIGLPEHQRSAAAVRVVALPAVPVADRGVRRRRALLAPDGVGVAGAAHRDEVRLHELPLRRRVRVVAGEAALALEERPVHAPLPHHRVHLLGVAAGAQRRALLARLEDRLPARRRRDDGLRRLVAARAHAVRDRRVDLVVEHAACVGAVRVVAARAARLPDRVAPVLLREDRLVHLVAPSAEVGDLPLEELAGRGRPVRLVAGGAAALLDRAVLHLRRDRAGDELLVAARAQVAALLDEVVLRARAVRIVARDAVALRDRRVRAPRLRRLGIAVAARADPARLLRQQLAVARGVRAVALRALLRADRRVDELPVELLLEVGVALQADLAGRAGLELARVRLRGRSGGRLDGADLDGGSLRRRSRGGLRGSGGLRRSGCEEDGEGERGDHVGLLTSRSPDGRRRSGARRTAGGARP